MIEWLKNVFSKGAGATNGTASWRVLFGGSGSQTRVILARSDLERLFYGWVYACVSARAEDVGEIQMFVMKKKGNKYEKVEDHPVLDLLARFNNSMTKADVFSLLSMHLDIFGKHYWRILNKGESIVPLMPDCVVENVDDDGVITSYIYKNTINGKQREILLSVDEVICFKTTNPFSMNSGYSIVQAAYEWAQTELNATNWNMKFFENSAIPTTMLKTTTPIGTDAEKRLKVSFNEMYSGVNNAHKTGVLPNGVEVVKLMDSLRDMDFANLDVRYQNKILAMFRVPRSRLGITDDVNRANAEATNYVYALRAIRPQMRKIVDAINEFLLPIIAPKDDIYIDFVSPVPEDETAILERDTRALAGQAYMSVNEVRASRGLQPIQGGENVMTGFNSVPLGTTIDNQSDAAPTKTFKPRFKNFKNARQRAAVEGASKDIAMAIKGEIENYVSQTNDLELHKQLVRRSTERQNQVRKETEQMNNEVQKLFTDAELKRIIEELGGAKSAQKSLLSDKQKILSIIIGGLSVPLKRIATDESKYTQQNLGAFGEYTISAQLEKYIDRFISKLGRSYADTTIDEIKDEIKQGLTDGLNIKVIRNNLIKNVFDGTMKVRAELIARTEVYRFANLGLRDGYKESGVVSTVRWYTAEDERVCEFCGPLDGKTVDVAANFYEQGDVVVGKDGGAMALDYSEVFGGPLHPQCRCYVRPDKISV